MLLSEIMDEMIKREHELSPEITGWVFVIGKTLFNSLKNELPVRYISTLAYTNSNYYRNIPIEIDYNDDTVLSLQRKPINEKSTFNKLPLLR